MKMACPNCGGNIIYEMNTKYVYCEHCNQKIDVDKVDVSEYEKYVETINNKVKEKSDIKLLINRLITSNKDGQIPKENQKIYVCSVCNSEFVHNKAYGHTTCPFCFMESKKIKDDLDSYKVAKIIPFQLKKNNIANIVSNAIELDGFSSNNVYEMYVPFIASYDEVHGKGKVSKNGNFQDVLVDEKILTFRYIGKSLDKQLANKCIDFDFLKIVDFDDKLFGKGVILDSIQTDYKRDDDDELKKNIIDNINLEVYLKREMNSFYNSKYDIEITNIKEEVWLFPVYIHKQIYKGNIYTFLINGQNGKVVGKVVKLANNRKIIDDSLLSLLPFAILSIAVLIFTIIKGPIFIGLSVFLMTFLFFGIAFVVSLEKDHINDYDNKNNVFYGITWNNNTKLI